MTQAKLADRSRRVADPLSFTLRVLATTGLAAVMGILLNVLRTVWSPRWAALFQTQPDPYGALFPLFGGLRIGYWALRKEQSNRPTGCSRARSFGAETTAPERLSLT